MHVLVSYPDPNAQLLMHYRMVGKQAANSLSMSSAGTSCFGFLNTVKPSNAYRSSVQTVSDVRVTVYFQGMRIWKREHVL